MKRTNPKQEKEQKKKIKIITTRKQLPCRFLPLNIQLFHGSKTKPSEPIFGVRWKTFTYQRRILQQHRANNNMRKLCAALVLLSLWSILFFSVVMWECASVFMNACVCICVCSGYTNSFEHSRFSVNCLSITVRLFYFPTLPSSSAISILFIGYLFHSA